MTALEQVLQAEKESETIIAEATKKKEAIIAAAKQEKEAAIKDLKVSQTADRETALQKKREDISKKVSALETEAAAAVEKVTAKFIATKDTLTASVREQI